MEKNERRFCPAIWFSGFFGLGTLVHFVRLVFRIPLTVGGWEVPFRASAAAVVVLGLLSAGLLVVGIRRPCCEAGKPV